MSDGAAGRLAVDIGGTFTDVVFDLGGRRTTTKVLTTPAAPADGVVTGLTRVLSLAGAAPADVSVVLHGTTLATNALIQRRGAKTALVTTAGHRDVLEMAFENRFEQYDINSGRPEPLVPRRLRLTVPERMSAAGEVLAPLDVDAVRALAPLLDGASVVAVGPVSAAGIKMSEEDRQFFVDVITNDDKARELAGRFGEHFAQYGALAPELREVAPQSG